MPAMDIPDPLPPAITPPHTVIEFLIDQHLEEFGDTGLVARTWHWVLHGGGPGPISHMDWSQFDGNGPPRPPPSPRKVPPTSRPCTRPPHGPSSTRPDSSAGYTPPPRDEVPMRFRPWDTALAPAVTEDGSVTSPCARYRPADRLVVVTAKAPPSGHCLPQ